MPPAREHDSGGDQDAASSHQAEGHAEGGVEDLVERHRPHAQHDQSAHNGEGVRLDPDDSHEQGSGH